MELPDKHIEGYIVPKGYHGSANSRILEQALPRGTGYTLPDTYHAELRQQLLSKTAQPTVRKLRTAKGWMAIAAVLLPLIVLTTIIINREGSSSAVAQLEDNQIINYMVDVAEDIPLADLIYTDLIDEEILQELNYNDEAIDHYLLESIDDLDMEDLDNLL